MRAPLFGLILACLPAVSGAQGYRVAPHVEILPAATGFAVQDRSDFGARGIWCGAALHARDALGARGTGRLFVIQPRSRENRRGPVGFRLDPAGRAAPSVQIPELSLRTPGASLSVAHALSLCALSN